MWLSQSYDQRRASAVMVVRYSLLALIIFMLVCTLLAMVAVLVATQYTGLGHTLHDRTQGKCTSVERPFRFPFAPVELTPNHPGSLGFVGEHVLMFAQLSHSIAVPGRLGVTAKKEWEEKEEKKEPRSMDRCRFVWEHPRHTNARIQKSTTTACLLARFCHVIHRGRTGGHGNTVILRSSWARQFVRIRALFLPGFVHREYKRIHEAKVPVTSNSLSHTHTEKKKIQLTLNNAGREKEPNHKATPTLSLPFAQAWIHFDLTIEKKWMIDSKPLWISFQNFKIQRGCSEKIKELILFFHCEL